MPGLTNARSTFSITGDVLVIVPGGLNYQWRSFIAYLWDFVEDVVPQWQKR